MEEAQGKEDKAELKERLAPLEDLFLHIEKTLRAYRTYDAGHITISEFEKKLFSKFTDLLSQRKEFSVVVKPYEFHSDGKPIYSNTDKRENFSFKFHQDGIRQFHFEEGLTFDELHRFLQVLRTDFQSYEYSDDDTVTLLWKSELEHIAYVAVETFVRQGEETVDIEVLIRNAAQPFFKDTAPDEIAALLASSAAKARKIKSVDLREIEQLPNVRIEYGESLDKDTERIREEADSEVNMVLRKMVMVLMRILISAQQDQQFLSTANVLERILESLLRSKQYGMASRVLSKLIELSDPVRNPDAINSSLIKNFISGLMRPEKFEILRKDAGQLTKEEANGLGSLVQILPGSFTPMIFEIYRSTPNEALRKVLTPNLAIMGGDHFMEFSRAIPQADEALQLALIDLFVAIQNPQAHLQLRRLFHSGTDAVRTKIAEIVFTSLPDLALAMAESALREGTPMIRRKTLEHLRAHPNKKVGKMLFDFAQTSDFDDWERSEKIVAFQILAKWGGKALQPFFLDELNRSVLERSENTLQRQIASAWALKELGTPEARKAIEENAHRLLGTTELREVCEKVLATMGKSSS